MTKSEHHHGILDIWISQVPTFSLHWQLWVSWSNCPKKGTAEQNKQSNKLPGFAFCIGNVSSTIDFEYFRDLKNLIILKIEREIG